MAYKLVLVGNPNCGKTSLFNIITNSRQHVGNFPGVTVEKKTAKTPDRVFEVTDLPGMYSLFAYSPEEKVARDFLLNKQADVVINIIDGCNPERSLYLTLQLAELKIPMIIAVNMFDEARKKGVDISYVQNISRILGVPAVWVSAKTGENIEDLIDKAKRAAEKKSIPRKMEYTSALNLAVNEIEMVLSENRCDENFPYAFYALKIIEGDQYLLSSLSLNNRQLDKIKVAIKIFAGEDLHNAGVKVAKARYDFINEKLLYGFKKPELKDKKSLSDKLDFIILGRFFAFPLFAAVMFLVFYFTFCFPSSFLGEIFETFFTKRLPEIINSLLSFVGAPKWLVELIAQGVVGGVGSVLAFLPQIAVMFFCLSFLEDCGYMARAAFLTDGLLKRTGLSGKALFPLIMGFGCTVPAAMAARVIEEERERILAIRLAPFMSCSAKLPVYMLLAGTFFADFKGIAVSSLYFAGIIGAVLFGTVCSKCEDEASRVFIMEFPPYRIPGIKTLLLHSWEKVKGFAVKAGTVILLMSVFMWFLSNFNTALCPAENAKESILGIMGSKIAPFLVPLGFGSWEAAAALLSGIVAKESIVSTLSVLAAGSGLTTAEYLKELFNPLSAYAFMLFILLYFPCISALVVIKRELKSLKLAFKSMFFQLLVAYGAAFAFYQIASAAIRLVNAKGVIEYLITVVCAVLIAIIAKALLSEIKQGCAECGNCSEKSGFICRKKRKKE